MKRVILVIISVLALILVLSALRCGVGTSPQELADEPQEPTEEETTVSSAPIKELPDSGGPK